MFDTVVMINEFKKLASSKLENNLRDDISCFSKKLLLLEIIKTWILNNHKVQKLMKIKKKKLNKNLIMNNQNRKKRRKRRRKKRRNQKPTQILIGRR